MPQSLSGPPGLWLALIMKPPLAWQKKKNKTVIWKQIKQIVIHKWMIKGQKHTSLLRITADTAGVERIPFLKKLNPETFGIGCPCSTGKLSKGE